MHNDLDHLPDRKRRDLERVVHVLFAGFEQATSLSTQNWRRQGRILKVILYGSYARGRVTLGLRSGASSCCAKPMSTGATHHTTRSRPPSWSG